MGVFALVDFVRHRYDLNTNVEEIKQTCLETVENAWNDHGGVRRHGHAGGVYRFRHAGYRSSDGSLMIEVPMRPSPSSSSSWSSYGARIAASTGGGRRAASTVVVASSFRFGDNVGTRGIAAMNRVGEGEAADGARLVRRGANNNETEDRCVVCLDLEKSHTFVPCGHLCVCEQCSRLVLASDRKQCPLCRQPAVGSMKIFTV